MRKILPIVLIILAVISFIMFFVTRNKQEYIIIFDSNGGSSVKQQKIKYHKKVVKPDDPVKENYKFIGWQNNGIIYNFDTKVEENMLLTASWQENNLYVVKITLEGVEYESKFYDGKPINIENYTLQPRDGYHIVLYNGGQVYDLSTPVTENLNLVAQYEKNSF